MPQRSFLGPLLFLIYTNDPPLNINTKWKLVLFANHTSALIANNFNYLQKLPVSPLMKVNEWFTVKGLFIYLLIVFQNPYTGVHPMDIGTVKE